MIKSTDIIRCCASPRGIFWLTVAVLAIPNVALCFTERMGIMASVTNIVLPVAAVWRWAVGPARRLCCFFR